MPKGNEAFYRDPKYRKKMSSAILKWRASQTPEERAAHNKKIAISYRNSVAERLLMNNNLKYGKRKEIIRWRDAANERP